MGDERSNSSSYRARGRRPPRYLEWLTAGRSASYSRAARRDRGPDAGASATWRWPSSASGIPGGALRAYVRCGSGHPRRRRRRLLAAAAIPAAAPRGGRLALLLVVNRPTKLYRSRRRCGYGTGCGSLGAPGVLRVTDPLKPARGRPAGCADSPATGHRPRCRAVWDGARDRRRRPRDRDRQSASASRAGCPTFGPRSGPPRNRAHDRGLQPAPLPPTPEPVPMRALEPKPGYLPAGATPAVSHPRAAVLIAEPG